MSCVRADGVSGSSDWLRSTAARIQVMRGRSKYRQSGVFKAVTQHISKLFRGFDLTVLPQKSETILAEVSFSVLKIKCAYYLCIVAKPMAPNHCPVQCSQT